MACTTVRVAVVQTPHNKSMNSSRLEMNATHSRKAMRVPLYMLPQCCITPPRTLDATQGIRTTRYFSAHRLHCDRHPATANNISCRRISQWACNVRDSSIQACQVQNKFAVTRCSIFYTTPVARCCKMTVAILSSPQRVVHALVVGSKRSKLDGVVENKAQGNRT